MLATFADERTTYAYALTHVWTGGDLHLFPSLRMLTEALQIYCEATDTPYPTDGPIEGRDYEIICVTSRPLRV